ncbi:MAG: cytochrome b [Betaproteobacteria bacterium]
MNKGLVHAGARVGYAAPMVLMHWLMLALIAVAYALMELKSLAPRGSELRINMANVHYLTGLTVFALVWLRLVLRMTTPVPPIEPPPAAWENAVAKAVHGFFYAFMVALPLLGWFALSAKGKPVHRFLFDLPFPIGTNDALARQLKEIHEALATAGYFAFGLHAAAALFHHYRKRDTTLLRMLPRRWR